MQYIIVDLEATCWETGTALLKMEIIEIGAVRLNAGLAVEDEFARFVKPIQNPILSKFCQQLTSITQAQVDAAENFSAVFPKFLNWIGKEPFTLCSWGNYDFKQFQADCKRHGIAFPFSSENHINLKKLFSERMNVRPSGLTHALKLMGLPMIGTHHRGIDDARNIAHIAQIILPP